MESAQLQANTIVGIPNLQDAPIDCLRGVARATAQIQDVKSVQVPSSLFCGANAVRLGNEATFACLAPHCALSTVALEVQ